MCEKMGKTCNGKILDNEIEQPLFKNVKKFLKEVIKIPYAEGLYGVLSAYKMQALMKNLKAFLVEASKGNESGEFEFFYNDSIEGNERDIFFELLGMVEQCESDKKAKIIGALYKSCYKSESGFDFFSKLARKVIKSEIDDLRMLVLLKEKNRKSLLNLDREYISYIVLSSVGFTRPQGMYGAEATNYELTLEGSIIVDVLNEMEAGTLAHQ